MTISNKEWITPALACGASVLKTLLEEGVPQTRVADLLHIDRKTSRAMLRTPNHPALPASVRRATRSWILSKNIFNVAWRSMISRR